MLNKLLFMLPLLLSCSMLGQQTQYQRSIPPAGGPDLEEATSVAISSRGILYTTTSNGKLVSFDEKGSPTGVDHNSGLGSTNLSCVFVDTANNLYACDVTTSQIVVQHADGNVARFGEKGGQIGQIDKVKSIAVDHDGFIYVLNGSRNQIDIFEPDGDYMTFVNGGFEVFEEPVAIGLNSQNELYVLDAKGPSIYIIDVFGNQALGHKNFTEWFDVPLKNADAMTVCPNGEFFVLDSKSCLISRFDRKGKIQSTAGSKGKSAAGIFEKPALLSCAAGGNALVVADHGAGLAQYFVLGYESNSQLAEVERVKANFLDDSPSKKINPVRPLFRDMAVSSTGTQYVIPYDNPRTLISYNSAETAETLSLGVEFSDAVDVEIDRDDNIYVLDRGAKEVFSYDRNMGFQRKFGREIKQKLKDPSSIAIMRNGDILVCDAGNGNIHTWSPLGIHKSVLITTDGSPLESPVEVEVDSQGQIYILDDQINAIFRCNKDGFPFASETLKGRPVKSSKGNSKIAGFTVDQLDDIYLYNEDSHQVEMHAWDVRPKFRFTIGYDGRGANGFGSVGHLAFDEASNRVHCIEKNGVSQKVLQFYVKPPAPLRPTSFGIENGQLVFEFDRLDARSVKGYGLLRSDLGPDSIVAQTKSSKLMMNERHYPGLQLLEYEFVSLSSTAHSDPGAVIRNHLALGDRLLGAKHYTEAVLSYVEATSAFGESEEVAQHMASKLSESASELCENLEVGSAMQLMGYALMYAPDDKFARKVGQEAYFLYFNDFASRDDIPGILAEADVLRKSEDLGPVVMDAIDSLASKLGDLQNERSISNAIVLSNTLLDWDRTNARYSHTLAKSHYELFKLKSQLGFPALELQLIIEDARKHASKAVLTLKQGKHPYFDENIIFLEILNASGQYSQVETHAINALTQGNFQLSKEQIKAHRMELAEAYIGLKNFKQAVQEYRQVESIDPDDPGTQHRLGDALIKYGDVESAKTLYEKLLLQDVTNAEFTGQLGRIELLLENYPEASFQLEKAIKLDPTDRTLYGPLAEAFRGASNNNKALEYFMLAAEYQTLIIQQAENSIASFAETSDLVEKLVEYEFSIAQISDQLGDYKGSIEAYRRALIMDPQNTTAHSGLGESAIKAGYVYDAVKHFGLATSIDPGNINYAKDHESALKLQEENAINKTPISLLDLQVDDLFPSLYHNYADPGVLPIGELVIANNTESPITPTKVTVFVAGLMRSPSQVQSPALLGFSNTYVDLGAVFTKEILEQTDDQTLQLEVEVDYVDGGQTKTLSMSTPFLMHGRNAITWSDKRRLSCFVDPKQEVLLDYCRRSNTLFANQPAYDLNDAIVEALQQYTLLHQNGYTYSPDPVQDFAYVSTHTTAIDYLQYPTETIKRKSGDCDDLVTLFCALLENSGVATAYIDVPGHVFMAFDSQIKADNIGSSGLSIDDVIIVKDQVWIPVETTMIGKFGFMRAWKNGARRYYKELREGSYPEIVPFGDARQVYTPSAFKPAGFNATASADQEAMLAYDTEVAELLAKVNQTAIRELESRYQTEPDNVFVKNRYATLLARLGHHGQAEQVLLEALELSPENASALNNLANINMVRGNFETAVGYYAAAAEIDEKDGHILINLCKAYLETDDKEQALVSFEKAVAIDAELENLYEYLLIQLR